MGWLAGPKLVGSLEGYRTSADVASLLEIETGNNISYLVLQCLKGCIKNIVLHYDSYISFFVKTTAAN